MFTLYFAMMVVGMGQTVVFAILPMLGRELKLDEIIFTLPFLDISFAPREMAITSLSAMTALVFALTSPFWGRLSDRFGRKPLIIFGLLGYTVGTLTFNTAAHFGLIGLVGGTSLYLLLVVTRLFHATIMSATHPAASAYIVDVTSLKERTKGISKLGVFNQLGTMVGPALAWFVSISFLAPMYLQAGITFIAAMLVVFFLPPTESHKTRPTGPAKKLKPFDPRYRTFVLIGFAIFSMMGMVQQTLGFYYQDILHLESVRAAQLFSTAMVVSSVAVLVAQFGVVQRYNGPPIKLVRFGLPFCLVGYLILANAQNLPMLLGAMAFFGLGMGMAGPGYTVSATLSVEAHEQGALAGLMGSAAGMGFVIGPILGGFLYRLDPSLPYWSAAGVMVLVLAAVRNLGRTTERVVEKQTVF
ncbi:MAG: DHA1 family multidrug resistance protein-like MFS transporter [Bermanella sp.]|jgi:DHA1 family multidrug resistance protein-like MFS transporter